MRKINRYSLTGQKIDHQVFDKCKQLTDFIKSQIDQLGNNCLVIAPASGQGLLGEIKSNFVDYQFAGFTESIADSANGLNGFGGPASFFRNALT